MNRIAFVITAAALSTAAVFSIPQAFASDMKLSWGDLDLSTKDGQKTLERRINAITSQMCADQIQTGTRINNVQRCRTDLKAQLIAQVSQVNKRVAMGN